MNFTKNVRLRLTLWYTLVLAVMLLAFSATVYVLLSNNLNHQLDDEIRVSAIHLSDIITNEKVKLSGDATIDVSEIRDFQIQQGELAQIFSLDGTRLLAIGLQAGGSQIQPVVSRALKAEKIYIDTTTTDGKSVRIYAAPILDGSTIVGAVIVGRTTDGIRSVLGTFKSMASIATVVITLLAGGGGFFLTSRALKPVRLFTNTAREIGAGDLNQRIEVSYGDEIGLLATTLNNMFDRLQAAFNRERRFTSDASHELRTPLAIIEAEATLTLEKTRSKNEYKRALGVITQEATHMSRLINGLLFLARSDAGKETLNMEPLDLGAFIKDLAGDVSILCRRKKLKLTLGRLENLIVQGDETRLRQLFLNILENAIRYTPPKGAISVSVTGQDDMAVVTITDTGPGIPAEDLAHIFEPFFRVDEGRSRTDGGTGLGLAIGQRIARALGGRIEVESQVNKGSSFTVFLPVDLTDQAILALTLAKKQSALKTKRINPFRLLFWK